MGAEPSAVVDPQLRVNGIEGLRVVDASIMPAAPNACTHAPTIMMGEKGAALVAADA